jgi:hypothetical protein
MSPQFRDRIPETLAKTNLRDLLTWIAGPPVTTSGAGPRYHCPNPKHPDAHPSFTIKGQRWRCWSQCAASGNAIDLLLFVGWVNTKADAIELLTRWIEAPR